MVDGVVPNVRVVAGAEPNISPVGAADVAGAWNPSVGVCVVAGAPNEPRVPGLNWTAGCVAAGVEPKLNPELPGAVLAPNVTVPPDVEAGALNCSVGAVVVAAGDAPKLNPPATAELPPREKDGVEVVGAPKLNPAILI